MYRIIFFLIVGFGLIACSNNDKRVDAQESYAVYMSTVVTPNAATGEKTYVGPPINTMDANNTFEMLSLRSEQSPKGAKSYELLVLLTYLTDWRYYDSANLENKPASTFKVISREAGVCEERGCVFKELMSIQLTDDFLHSHSKDGFQISISSKSGIKSDLYVPPAYIKGYLKAVDGKGN